MTVRGLTLLVPDTPDPERDEVARAWEAEGGSVLRLARFWEPPALEARAVRVYGPETFARVLEQKLGLALFSPDDDLLPSLGAGWLGRRVTRRTRAEALDGSFPCFVKSAVPKLTPSRVYRTPGELLLATTGLADDDVLHVSEVTTWGAEVRTFVLDGEVLDAAAQEGEADTRAASEFVRRFVSEHTGRSPLSLPRAVVVDVGSSTSGWSVVECNAAWGAGLDGCRAAAVLGAIAAASGPAA